MRRLASVQHTCRHWKSSGSSLLRADSCVCDAGASGSTGATGFTGDTGITGATGLTLASSALLDWYHDALGAVFALVTTDV